METFKMPLILDIPPKEILDAAKKIEDYFEELGVRKWKFCGIQNRED